MYRAITSGSDGIGPGNMTMRLHAHAMLDEPGLAADAVSFRSPGHDQGDGALAGQLLRLVGPVVREDAVIIQGQLRHVDRDEQVPFQEVR